MELIVKMSSKNQIVIPKAVRKLLNIDAGDELVMDVENDKATIKVRPKNYAAFTEGLGKEIWANVNVDEYIRKEREGWKK